MSFASKTRWSDIYISATSRFLAGAAQFTLSVTLLLSLQTAGMGGLAVSALILSATLPMVVLAPLTGRIADRYDSRLLILISGVVQSAAVLGLIFVDGLFAILALAMVGASGVALLQPVMGALLPVMSTKEDLPKASAVGQTGALVGMMAGPAIAGLIMGEFGATVALVCAAGMSLSRTFVALAIRSRRRGGVVTGGEPTAEVAEKPVAYKLRNDRLMVAMVAGLAAVIGILSASNVIEVFLVRESFGASESMYGFINGTWMAGMAVGAWLAATVIAKTRHDGQLAYLLMGLLAVSCLVMVVGGGVIYEVALLIPLYLVGGATNAGENSVVGVSLARRVPLEAQGRANATMSAALNGASLIGFVGGGLAMEYFTPRQIFVVLGLAGLLALAANLPLVHKAAQSVGRRVSVEEKPLAKTTGEGIRSAEHVIAEAESIVTDARGQVGHSEKPASDREIARA